MRGKANGRDRTQIAQAILRYFVNHPTAADTIEGIARWWLERERIDRRVDDVVGSLRILVARGLIMERQGTAPRPSYQVNSAKWAEIEQLLEDTGGSSGRSRPSHRHPCFRGKS